MSKKKKLPKWLVTMIKEMKLVKDTIQVSIDTPIKRLPAEMIGDEFIPARVGHSGEITITIKARKVGLENYVTEAGYYGYGE